MTPADHANTVRETLGPRPPGDHVLAALDALQAQAETADAALIDGQAAYEAMGLRAETAEAERDHARDALRWMATEWAKYAYDTGTPEPEAVDAAIETALSARAALAAREEAQWTA